jgi:hypothetical protein
MALQIPNTQIPTLGAKKIRTNLYIAKLASDFYDIPIPDDVSDSSSESDESGSATHADEDLHELQSKLDAAIQSEARMASHHKADQHLIELWQEILGMPTPNRY